MNILTGMKAERTCNKIISGHGTNLPGDEKWHGPKVTGYFPEGRNAGKPEGQVVSGFTAFDNTTEDLWIEWFKSESDAVAWCNGEIEGFGLRGAVPDLLAVCKRAELDLYDFITNWLDLDPEEADVPAAHTWRECKAVIAKAEKGTP